jgi:hypothetical protein
MAKPFALSPAQQRRLDKLARGAGRPAAETLGFVLRDGFEFCEWEVRESRADGGTGRRGAVPDSEAQRRALQLIDSAHGRRRTRKAA